MRNLPISLQKKISSRIQAGDTALSASLWVSRPTTPLMEDRFLEKQLVLSGEGITKTSIAISHPHLMRSATNMFIGYLQSGMIKIAKATYMEDIDRQIWNSDIGYSQEADDFCLCFDGTMPKAPNGKVEFKTEQMPWVFWVLDGALYGKKLFDNSVTSILAEENCSTVTAVRAMWSSTGGFDFGLVVFFVLNGDLYYRQLINGVWTDAEVVSFGPTDVEWVKIAAFRTWDYRIGIQGITSENECYEMFTEFMGIGKQNTEHISISDIRVSKNFADITYINAKEDEHIEASSIEATGNMYRIGAPDIVEAYNIPVTMIDPDTEEEYEDWGIKSVIVFNRQIVKSQVEAQYQAFTLVDSRNVSYIPLSAELGEDGHTLTLTFTDFNNAYGTCQIKYAPGTVQTMAGSNLVAVSKSFTPQNLNPSQLPVPEVESIWNE